MRYFFIVYAVLSCLGEWAYGQQLDEAISTKNLAVKSAIRLRINDPAFKQLSHVTGVFYNRQISRVAIPPQQQCFPEGCMQIYAFQITGHRPPSVVTVSPNPPNLISISIRDFDLFITGSLSGQMQPLPPLPIAFPVVGNLAMSSTQLGVSARIDIQKTEADIPYIRLVSCALTEGTVYARVENMGLVTQVVNARYQNEITAKAREVLQSTLCSNVNDIIASEFSTRLAKIPTSVTAGELLDLFIEQMPDIQQARQKRTTAVLAKRDKRDSEKSLESERVVISPSVSQSNSTNVSKFFQGSFFNTRKLSQLIILTSLVDSGATFEKFFVGIDGEVRVTGENPPSNPNIRPTNLKFRLPSKGRTAEMLISEYTLNTLLLMADSIGAIVFRVGSETPIFGKLLRTTCSMDEVCLSDSVPEPGEMYPNKQLEVILRATHTPTVHFSAGSAILYFEGRALFFLEGTTQKVGVIPFESTSLFHLSPTDNGTITGSFEMPSFNFKESVEFFGLPLDSLSSLRDATKGALKNLVNSKLKEGIALSSTKRTAIISNPSVEIVDAAVLLHFDVDVEKYFDAHGSATSSLLPSRLSPDQMQQSGVTSASQPFRYTYWLGT